MSEQIELIVAPTDGKENLRNSEGSIVVLNDNSLLLSYTRFRGGSSSDFAPADIVTRASSDGGRTWTQPSIVARGSETLVSKQMSGHVLSTSFVRLGSGAIALFYGRTTYTKGPGYHLGNMNDISMYCFRQITRISQDEGQSWSEERDITVPGEHSQVLLNDSAVHLSSGRLILPNYHGLSPYAADPEFVQPLISDDDGKNWFLSKYRVCSRKEGRGCLSESSVVERSDGSLLMMSRTGEGYVYRCESQDQGETWSEPLKTDLPASGTPTSLRRVPNSDDLLLLWNQVRRLETQYGFNRHRLTAAISADGGYTWKHRRNLESLDDQTYIAPEEGGTFDEKLRIRALDDQMAKMGELGLSDRGPKLVAYPSLVFSERQALITYIVVPTRPTSELPRGCSLKLRILPVEWFYEYD